MLADRYGEESGQRSERGGGNGFGRLRHGPLWSLNEQIWSPASHLSCHVVTSKVAQTPTVHLLMLYLQTCALLLPDAHAQIKHAHFPAAQGHRVSFRSQKTAQFVWLWSRGCCLIYRLSLWACACRVFAYLLCHRAGNQLWAQHSGTMHLPRWQWAKYLIQSGPSITLVKLWCPRCGIYRSVHVFRLKTVIWPHTVKQ